MRLQRVAFGRQFSRDLAVAISCCALSACSNGGGQANSTPGGGAGGMSKRKMQVKARE